ncbi:hypothetical protein GCM10018775_80840 [Streptomyces umbrinus]|nr:hypothetical protein GCM10018775_80840 [Streptomyces umbrinus]
MSTRRSRGAPATSKLLRDLLVTDPRYKRLWSARVKRARGEVSQAAIAEVITLYLWESGERSENSTALTRTLKDRVSRALNGIALSSETLGWIIAAFGMDSVDEARLWATF